MIVKGEDIFSGEIREARQRGLQKCEIVWTEKRGRRAGAVGGVPLCPLLMGDLNRGRMGGLNGWEEPFGLHQ